LGTSFGLGKIKIGIFGEKGFETWSFFSGLMSVRLSEPSASVPSWFWTQFAWASCKRTWLVVLDTVRLSEPQASEPISYWNLVAQANQTSLKRAESCSATFDFLLRALGDQSELLRMFLLTCLIIVYISNPIGSSFEVKLDMNLWKELNLLENVQERRFFRNLFFSSEWCRVKYVCCSSGY